MSELKSYKGDVTIPVYGTIADAEVYLKKDVDAVITELKAKLENVQASMYADVVDANMEIRRLRRALYKACANWAHATIYYSGIHESDEFKWEDMETECLKKAEEYK